LLYSMSFNLKAPSSSPKRGGFPTHKANYYLLYVIEFTRLDLTILLKKQM